MVTKPRILPNSSTTRAMPTWWVRNSRSSSLAGLVSGTMSTSRKTRRKSKGGGDRFSSSRRFAIEKDPYHVLDMYEAEDVVWRAAVNRDPRTLGCCENSHHFVQVGFHGKRVYVRPRHHNLPHLDLREFHGAQNEFFFAGAINPRSRAC